jgi:hypothetical protein
MVTDRQADRLASSLFGNKEIPMIRLALLASAAVLLSATADAAVPPQYQRPKEIRAILEDAKVLEAFNATHPIEKIERIENAHYRVSSGSCVMDITLVDDPAAKHPPNWYGSWAFVVQAGNLTCR